jgi:amino acid permease
MSPDPLDGLFNREALLAGLPARRANALLFLIESRTAHLVARSRRAMERFLTEQAAQERELAFLEAYALGRDPPLRPTIQDLERYSPAWAPLVPANTGLRAALAHRLGEKYEFTYQAVPGIRAALGLDETEVRQAYERLYGEPLERIFTARSRLSDRLRAAWTGLSERLEHLPPFWTAYSLTLTETVGATILALPIALAAVGPLPGLMILVVLGLVNILTVAFMAEAISRSGTIRYGSAFLGRVVGDYLGPGGSLVFTVSLFVLCLLILPVFYIGFAATLEDATRVPASIWVAVLFVAGLYYVRRQSLTATIASALVVGAINIGLIIALSSLAFTHAELDNLRYVNLPLVGGRPFDSSFVALVFGVVLAAYFGHTSVAICGRVVLHRDPTARSLIWGCVAAQATAILVYCLFVLAVNGAVAPEALANEAGTALSPLARQVGPVVLVLGSAFVVLGLGMSSITFALALFSVVRERLPSARPVVIILPRRRARLLFERRGRSHARGGLRVALVYLGLDRGAPRFRVDAERAGSTQRVEATVPRRWEVLGGSGASALDERFPHLRDNRAKLSFELSDADEQSARLRITSNMRVAYEGEWDVVGFHLSEVLALPDSEAAVVGWMTRQGEVSLGDVAERIGSDAEAARALLAALVERGVVVETSMAGEPRYVARAAARRGGRLSEEVWQALAEPEATGTKVAGQETTTSVGRTRLLEIVLSGTGRFAIGVAPVLAAFLAAEWMVLTDSGSFVGLLNFVGTIVVSLLAGVFPVLLLRSSRRKGEYVPAAVYRILGNPVLLGVVYLFFLASVLLHGLVIWDNPLERAGALLAGAVMVLMTVIMLRRGAFAARSNLELREDESGQRATFVITAAGRPAVTNVRIEYPGREQRVRAAKGELPAFRSLRRLAFDAWPGHGEHVVTRELKIWTHRITAEHGSESLPARLKVHLGEETRDFDMELSQGQVILPLTHPSWWVDIAPSN